MRQPIQNSIIAINSRVPVKYPIGAAVAELLQSEILSTAERNYVEDFFLPAPKSNCSGLIIHEFQAPKNVFPNFPAAAFFWAQNEPAMVAPLF
jgi:hypothetical protein